MKKVEEEMPQQFFNVNVDIDRTPYEFMVIPGQDPKKQDAEFIVGLDGEDCGILKMEFPERWAWSDGSLGEDLAEAIGNQIEKRYM
ncbi:hypothetical protein [Desertivirga arenae]|uniref:hypothetical protein n=1 Tax=Desertivirga arenae TaxID=2810309 RepID=UPI001A97C7E7|nr:hypothetical protein [Pedobacter sp. SYSU D00823]